MTAIALSVSEGDVEVVTLGGPVIPNVVLEVLRPNLGSRIVGENSLDDVLVLKLMVVCMFQEVDTICEVGQSYLIRDEEFRLALLEMLFNLLEAAWQLLSNVCYEMLVFLFISVQEWNLELGGLGEPSILRVNEHIDLVR